MNDSTDGNAARVMIESAQIVTDALEGTVGLELFTFRYGPYAVCVEPTNTAHTANRTLYRGALKTLDKAFKAVNWETRVYYAASDDPYHQKLCYSFSPNWLLRL